MYIYLCTIRLRKNKDHIELISVYIRSCRKIIGISPIQAINHVGQLVKSYCCLLYHIKVFIFYVTGANKLSFYCKCIRQLLFFRIAFEKYNFCCRRTSELCQQPTCYRYGWSPCKGKNVHFEEVV